MAVSIALAVAFAWAGLALAFATDWPTSFWITTLGSGAYVLSGAAAGFGRGRR